jgi:preprotein translocase subunit SecG
VSLTKNELVNEIRKNYEEIAKLSKTPVNITQQLQTFSINLKKEISEHEQNLLTNSQFVLLFLFFVYQLILRYSLIYYSSLSCELTFLLWLHSTLHLLYCPERTIHNKNEDANSKQATSNNRLLEVINN